MPPRTITIGGEQRYIGKIAHAVPRIADDAGLPGGFRVSSTAAADDAGDRRTSGRAAAWAAATAPIRQSIATRIIATSRQIIAAPRRAIGGAEAEIRRDELAGAAVVPRDLWDIGFRRSICTGVGGIPVGAVGPRIGVTEIGAADGDVVWGRGGGVDADSVRRGRGHIGDRGRSRKHPDRPKPRRWRRPR
jgi:hypothetical protein